MYLSAHMCKAKGLKSSTTGCFKGCPFDLFLMIYMCPFSMTVCAPVTFMLSTCVREMMSQTLYVLSCPIKIESFVTAPFFFFLPA